MQAALLKEKIHRMFNGERVSQNFSSIFHSHMSAFLTLADSDTDTLFDMKT